MKNRKNKHRALHSLIKKESWELEDVKQMHRIANENVDKASAQLEQSDRTINELNGMLRDAMKGDIDLSLDTIQMSKQYLLDKQAEHAQIKETHRHAKLVADTAALRLKQKLMTKKGLEHTLQKREAETKKESEKKASSAVEENWLQHRKGEV